MKFDGTQQFPLLTGIEVHEFLYQKNDVVSPHSSLWGDFNFSLNGTLEFDIEGKLIFANENFLRTMEYESYEIIGKKHNIFVDQEQLKSIEYLKFWDDLKNGETKNDLYKRITKSGKVKWFIAALSPVKDELGRIVKIVKIATDLTESTESSKETQEAADEVSRVLSSLSEGDLTQKYNIDSKGKLKIMGESVNRTIEILNYLRVLLF
jgi:methyl-accepting chemotaxis protein